MEQGKIKDFTETDKIDRVRRAHTQRHTSTDEDAVKKVAKHSNSKSMVCQYYNLGTCSQQNTYETKRVLYRHICSFCFVKSGENFQHTESDCRNKQKSKKQ